MTDAQILAVARACFIEHGLGISTTVIAERLGISHAVLFQRFGTKEHLFRAALQASPEQPWMKLARSGPVDRDARGQLLELAREIYAHLETVMPASAVLRSAGIQVQLPNDRPEDMPPVRARRELAEWFARAMSRGVLRSVRPEHVADLLLGALQFRPFHQHISQQRFAKAENDAYLEFVVDAVWRTLAPARGSARVRRASRPRRRG